MKVKALDLDIRFYAQKYLNEPFIFISCDTLFKEEIDPPKYNWVGYDDKIFSNSFRSIKINNNLAQDIVDKGSKGDDLYPYIGLAGIHDYYLFWQLLENGGYEAIDSVESFPLNTIALKEKLHAKKITWFDTGQVKNLLITRKQIQNQNKFNILEKEGEDIWFVNNKVIKFSTDSNFIANRAKRANYLQPFVPKVINCKKFMYSYSLVEGEVLSKIITLTIFKNLLVSCKDFWIVNDLNQK